MLVLDAHRSLAQTLDAAVRLAGPPPALRGLGLRLGDVRALAGLADADGATVAELAGRLRTPHHGVAHALDHLEAAGRVERDGDEAWLTDDGRRLREWLWAVCASG